MVLLINSEKKVLQLVCFYKGIAPRTLNQDYMLFSAVSY